MHALTLNSIYSHECFNDHGNYDSHNRLYVYHYLLMGKRKARVFTMAESVSNWLDASCRILEHIEAVKGKSIQVDTGLNIATSSIPTYLTDVPAEANHLTPLPSPLTAGPDWRWASSPQLMWQRHLRQTGRAYWSTLHWRSWTREARPLLKPFGSYSRS